MREILFRGKTTTFGWVFSDRMDGINYLGFEGDLPIVSGFPVMPDTLGQYTGLTDCKGAKVFEGDIVEIRTGIDEETDRGFVCFNCGAWEMNVGYNFLSLFQQMEIGHVVEVIGNIHDNPELLEGRGRDSPKEGQTMAKYKAGDRVRIISKEVIETLERDRQGNVRVPGCAFSMCYEQQARGGEEAGVLKADPADGTYRITADDGQYWWEDWMFEEPAGPEVLPAEDAIKAMLNGGEVLYDKNGNRYRWDADRKNFFWRWRSYDAGGDNCVLTGFGGLRRGPAKRKRRMTRWECMAWANSEASRGWVVRQSTCNSWVTPQCLRYDSSDIATYQRARLLPDLSGVDEGTIELFEVEESV
ncbi:MAG: YopX family protein [Treponema sp.]|jgi:hypothetical protein|nr:YopX family protein [Treponema sp.]